MAFFDEVHSRIEMHLQARQALTVRWRGGERRFAQGERIHTENSYKYTVEGFDRLLHDAGIRLDRHRNRADHRNGKPAGDIGVGRDDHLVAWADFKRF